MMHSTLFCSTNILTKLILSTFNDFPKEIQRTSRTYALLKDFPGLENETKTFQDLQGLLKTRRNPVTPQKPNDGKNVKA